MESRSAFESVTTCQDCELREPVFDPEMGEEICSSCGTVVREKIETFDPGRGYSADAPHKGMMGTLHSLTVHDSGLSTKIAGANVDVKGFSISAKQRQQMGRLRHWDKVTNNYKSYHRNLKNAFSVLDIIKDRLALSDPIVENAAYHYRKAVKGSFVKGRSISAVVVASVYAACRASEVPRTLDEIATAANVDPVFAGKCYRLLVKSLGLHLPMIDSSKFLRRIANNARLGEKSFKRALEMMSIARESHIAQGKDPVGFSAAVLYAACNMEGERVNQARIALAADVSIVTLRKRIRDVKVIIPQPSFAIA